MGITDSGVVDGPRAADLLHLLLFGFVCDPLLLGHLQHHRCVHTSLALSISLPPPPSFTQSPDQTPAVVSSIQQHLTLPTRARLPRCMTYQSHWSIARSTIEADGKKEICIYCASTVPSTQCDAKKKGRKKIEPKEGAPR